MNRPEPLDARMAALIAGLPETLEDFLGHPARVRPPVVRRFLERLDELRLATPEPSPEAAAAGLRLTAEIPSFFPRAERLALRSRALEVWGCTSRQLRRFDETEASYITSLELLSAGGAAEPAPFVGLLGRWAVLEVERGKKERVERFVDESVRLAKSADVVCPGPTLLRLWDTVMMQRHSFANVETLAMAFYDGTCRATAGRPVPPVRYTLAVIDDDGRCTLDLVSRLPLPALPGGMGMRKRFRWRWTPDSVELLPVPAELSTVARTVNAWR